MARMRASGKVRSYGRTRGSFKMLSGKQPIVRVTETFSYRLGRPHTRLWALLVLAGLLMPLTLLLCTGANANADKSINAMALDSLMGHDATIMFLADNFKQLPEKQISISEDRSVYAQYAQPTTRYAHGILGDAIEAEQLVVLRNGAVYTQNLADNYVFEDIKPRLFDVDNDGQLEIVTIRTDVTKGAGIMIYKIENNALAEFAWVEEIGAPFRWLNIAAIYDLDGDGTVELAWIQTPHVGGILKVARIEPGKLEVLAESSRYSNHSIGERNLCLSVVSKIDKATTLYLPSQNRRQIAGFQFADGTLRNTETITQAVDFSQPLVSQHHFTNSVQGGNDCAGP